jgi:hypothetical protein
MAGQDRFTDNYNGTEYEFTSTFVGNLREEPLNGDQLAATGTNSRLRALLFMWGEAVKELYGHTSNPLAGTALNNLSSEAKNVLGTLNGVFNFPPAANVPRRIVLSDAGLVPEPAADPTFVCPEPGPVPIDIPNVWDLISQNVAYTENGVDTQMDFAFGVNNTETNQERGFGRYRGNLFSGELALANTNPPGAIDTFRFVVASELHQVLAPFPYEVPSGTDADFPYVETPTFSAGNPPTLDVLPDLTTGNPFTTGLVSKATLQYSLGRLWDSMVENGLLLFSVPCADNDEIELFGPNGAAGSVCDLRWYTRDGTNGNVTNVIGSDPITYEDPDETPALFCPPIVRRINREELESYLTTFAGSENGWVRLDLTDTNVQTAGIIFSATQDNGTYSNVNADAAATKFSLVYAVRRGPSTNQGSTTFLGSEFVTNVATISAELVHTTLSSVGGLSTLRGVEIGTNVTSIGSNAFRPGLGSNVSILLTDARFKVFADSKLQTIGSDAFSGCTILDDTMQFPGSLQTIGPRAFFNCNQIQAIDFRPASELRTIGQGAFANCIGAVGQLVIPGSVRKIEAGRPAGEPGPADYGAFEECRNISSINLSSAVALTSIGGYAFYRCSRAAGELVIPQSVLTIEENAFGECTSLASINLAGATQLTAFDPTAFSGCDQISGDLIFPPRLLSVPFYAFRDCTNVQSIGLGNADALLTIGTRAFSGCTSAAGELTIPGSVLKISEYAFYQCSGLQSINLGGASSLTDIGTSAFAFCESVEGELTIPQSVRKIGTYAFQQCSGLESINLGGASQLTGIGRYAFWRCESVQTINLGGASQLTSIEDNTFRQCRSATGELTIPQSVLTIGERAFEECTSLASINLAGATQLTAFHQIAFTSCNQISGDLIFPPRLLTVPFDAFKGFTNVQSIGLANADALQKIEVGAFSGCTSAGGELTVPQSVVTVGQDAFWGCSSLASINLAGATQLTAFDPTAFSGCDQISGDLIFPPKLREIGTDAFKGFRNIQSIGLADADALLTIGSSAFSSCRSAAGELIIPGSVQEIQGGYDEISVKSLGAFVRCSSLQTINLGDASQLTRIGMDAFYQCMKATGELALPEAVLTIGDGAFAECGSLQTINLGGASQLSGIGEFAFYQCGRATGELTIPQSVLTIGDGAFGYCGSLQTINLAGASQLTGIGNDAFNTCGRATGELRVPSGVTTIADNTFFYCTNLNSVVFDPFTSAQSVISIGFDAFAGLDLNSNAIPLASLNNITRLSSSIVFL